MSLGYKLLLYNVLQRKHCKNILIFKLIVVIFLGFLYWFSRWNDDQLLVYTQYYATSNQRCGLANYHNLSSHIHVINLNTPVGPYKTCIKTKTILNYISTNICLHEQDSDFIVSGVFRENGIWEESGVAQILRILIQHPYLDFIDIGANIGTYTMHVAALGRFVLAIDCFAPNLALIRQAVQLKNVINRVVLVQNALFSSSGESLRLSSLKRNYGAQELRIPSTSSQSIISKATNNSSNDDPYTVKTITFNELLPILVAHRVRGVVMKIDIEGSESFVFQNGTHIFDTIEVPFIQIEWIRVITNVERAKIILDFLLKYAYIPITCTCVPLKVDHFLSWPSDICFIKKTFPGIC